MGLNIVEVSGNSVATTGNGTDGWTFEADLNDPGVVVVSGDLDMEYFFPGEASGGYSFGALSTEDFGTLSVNTTDGTFTFSIDRDAVFASGSDQTVSFDVAGGFDTDTIIINLLICVARGTYVETATSAVPVEHLRCGDLVWTRDSGMLPLQWIGSRQVSTEELRRARRLRPVIVRAGALGPNRPNRDLTVSPQHKVLIDDWRAELFFGEREVLAPAKGLIDDATILVDHSCTPVEYFHLLFESHQIIRTNGAETESFRPGATTLNEIDRQARVEFLQLLPELLSDAEAYGPTARYSVTVTEARSLGGGLADAT